MESITTQDVWKVEGKFGIYTIPFDLNLSATYVCPGNIKIEHNERSHDNFFGYNIRRVIKGLKK